MISITRLHLISTALLYLVFLVNTGSSQTAITDQDLINLIGTVVELDSDTTGSVPIYLGNPGANQTYDFSTISIAGESVKNEFLAPGGTPFEHKHPDANFLEKSSIYGDGIELINYIYQKVTSNSMITLGEYNIFESDTSENLGVADTVPLPLTLGTQWTAMTVDTFSAGEGFLFLNRSININKVDGWGTIKLPGGDFACLRLQEEQIDITEQYVNDLLITSDTTSRTFGYNWIGKDALILFYAGSQFGEPNPDFTLAGNLLMAKNIAPSTVNEQNKNQPITNYILFQNYPNPFNPATTISYFLPYSSNVMFEFYDMNGELVDRIDPGNQASGTHFLQWRAGNQIASGAYLYRLSTENAVITKKMLLLR